MREVLIPMTSWKEIQNEIDATKSQEKPGGDFDSVRRGKYKLLSDLTKRPLIVYATAFHNPIKAQVAAPFLSIDLSDKDGAKQECLSVCEYITKRIFDDE